MGRRLYQRKFLLIYVIPATARHARAVALSLRQADRDECALLGHDPEHAILESVKASESYAVMSDGVPVGLFGCSSTGIIWMVGTDLLVLNRRELIAGAREFLDRWLMVHDELWNCLSSRNTTHINFLRHLGATFVWTRDGLIGRFSLVRSLLRGSSRLRSSRSGIVRGRLRGPVSGCTESAVIRE